MSKAAVPFFIICLILSGCIAKKSQVIALKDEIENTNRRVNEQGRVLFGIAEREQKLAPDDVEAAINANDASRLERDPLKEDIELPAGFDFSALLSAIMKLLSEGSFGGIGAALGGGAGLLALGAQHIFSKRKLDKEREMNREREDKAAELPAEKAKSFLEKERKKK